MRIRWLWFDYIPPELGLTAPQKKLARARARQNVRRLRSFHSARLKIIIVAVICWIALVIWQVLAPSGSSAGATAAIVQLASFAVFWCALALLYRGHFAPAMRRALSEMGFDVCRRCGYLLIGLDDEAKRCPECGGPRRVDRKPIPWNEASRRAIAECGYHACTECGAVFKDTEHACPECGAERADVNRD